MTIDLVLSKLKRVSPGAGGRWNAICPAHDDKKSSLSIKIGDNGGVLLKCHSPSRCSVQSIVAAIGLKMIDIAPPNLTSSRGNFMADGEFKCAYDYRDSDGKLLYQVCRFEPKRFSQRRPNPAFDPKKPRDRESNPEYLYSLDGVTRTIYRLPELLAAMKKNPDRYVFVLEGEKDVDVAWRNGIVATTNSGGALKWEERFGGFLKDFRVVIIPDNDPVDATLGYSPGRRHAEEVAASLHGKAKMVKIVDLPGVPPKGDFTDWWTALGEQGLSKDECKVKLSDLVKAAPIWEPKPKQETKPAEKAADAPKAAEKTADAKPVAAGLEESVLIFREFCAYHEANMASHGSANSAEWMGNFRMNVLIAEQSLLQHKAVGDNFKEAVFMLASQLLAGFPNATK